MLIGEKTNRLAFPMVEAALTDEAIDECQLRPGLVLLGERLIKQMGKSHGVVGIQIKNIGFTMLLKEE